MAKTWQEQLEAGEPKLKTVAKGMAGVPAGGTLLFPTPRLIKGVVDALPAGKALSLGELRERVAHVGQGDGSCPLTTSKGVRIVAEAAWDEVQGGKTPEQVTPFWRVVELDSSLARKLSCGPEFVRAMRQQEGID